MGSVCSVGRQPVTGNCIMKKFRNADLFQVQTIDMKAYEGKVSEASDGTIASSSDSTPQPMSPDSKYQEDFSVGSEPRMESGKNRHTSPSSTYLPGTTISLCHTVEDLPELELRPLPDLECFPDDITQLLMGRVSDREYSLPLKEMFLYICANLKDTEGEQKVLMENVFPHLRQYCVQKGYVLNVINLLSGTLSRHQLTDHSHGHLCLDILKSLVKSDRLIVLMILGEYFEGPSPPVAISENDFDKAIARMKSADDRELFHRWYSVDENAVPPLYVLKSTPDEPEIHSEEKNEEDPSSMWISVASRMVDILACVLPSQLKEIYLKSVLEEELELCLRSNPRSADRCVIAQRAIKGGEHEKAEHVERIRKLQSDLEIIVPAYNKIQYDTHPQEENRQNRNDCDISENYKNFCESITSKVQDIIDNILKEDRAVEEKNPYTGMSRRLLEELMLQERAVLFHLHRLENRNQLLSSVRDYILGPFRHPLVIHGAQGRGKTALIATASVLCSQWIPDAAVIIRLCATTPESSTQEKILRSVCEQWCLLYGEHPALAHKSIMEHSLFFSMLLQLACAERPLVIFLDGLDQVEVYSSRSLKWMPAVLPEHVKLILGVRSDSKEMSELKELFPTEDSVFWEVPRLNLRECFEIVGDILQCRSRRLTDSQLNLIKFCVLDSPDPAYCRLLGDLACRWPSSIKTPEESSAMRSLSGLVLKTLSAVAGKLGDDGVVQRILGLLLVAKNGLMDNEILDVVSGLLPLNMNDESVMMFQFPTLMWLYTKRELSFLITEVVSNGLRLFKWRSDAYRTIAKEFVPKHIIGKCSTALIEYFWKGRVEQAENENIASSNGATKLVRSHPFGFPLKRRRYEELTFMCITRNIPVRERFMVNAKWLLRRVSFGDPYDVLEDIKMYRRKTPDDREFDLIREVIQMSSYALSYEGTQLHSQIQGRMGAFFTNKDNRSRYPSAYSLYRASCTPPRPSFLCVGVSCLKELTYPIRAGVLKSIAPDDTFPSQLIWVPGHSALLSLNNDRDEITCWDACKQTEIGMFTGLPQVRFIEILDARRILVLCENHIKFYDIHLGKYLTQTEDIVDSSSLFFINKSRNHAMALSSSRSEVLQISIATGRVETKLHAGDDRYLAGLLVSADGSVCVCGDALQKPFPLLVWNMNNGQLVHEFRLPHHEYLTRLTDISEDGRYLVSAAKELLDASPNFLVVYDTTTGKLVWSWKTGLNTTAVKASAQCSCIISANENTSIFIWDLASGKRRFTFWGHSAPVNSIQILARDNRCLTCDTTSTDRSIRLWDLMTGCCIAAFTPDQSITCCIMSEHNDMVALGLVGRRTPAVLSLCHHTTIPSGHSSVKKRSWTPMYSDEDFEDDIPCNIEEPYED